MRRAPLLSLLAVLLALPLAGCATIDEVYGVPEATRWTYFQAETNAVAGAMERALNRSGYQVERIGRTDAGEVALGVSLAQGSSDFTEILIQPFDDPDDVFYTRVQTLPRKRPIPRGLRIAVAADL